MNETSQRTRVALCICATDSSRWITRDLFRSSTCLSRDEPDMKRLLYELSESWKIAAAQMRSNLTRSTLTALGVIIGIIAVTLMGTAVNGISIGFDKSMAVLGDDVLYVTQWPWKPVDDWWNYRDRKKIKTEYAETLNRIMEKTTKSNRVHARPNRNPPRPSPASWRKPRTRISLSQCQHRMYFARLNTAAIRWTMFSCSGRL